MRGHAGDRGSFRAVFGMSHLLDAAAIFDAVVFRNFKQLAPLAYTSFS